MGSTPTPARAFTFKVQQKYFDFIRAGRKTVEGRCATGEYLTVQEGDIVNFQVDSDNAGEETPTTLTCEITRVQHYNTFSDMLQNEGGQNCLPGTADLQAGIDTYQSFPSYKEKEREFGVLAFEIKLRE